MRLKWKLNCSSCNVEASTLKYRMSIQCFLLLFKNLLLFCYCYLYHKCRYVLCTMYKLRALYVIPMKVTEITLFYNKYSVYMCASVYVLRRKEENIFVRCTYSIHTSIAIKIWKITKLNVGVFAFVLCVNMLLFVSQSLLIPA